MNRLPRWSSGSPIRADDLNRLSEAIERGLIHRVIGGRLRGSGSGYTLTIEPTVGGGGGSRPGQEPLDLLIGPAESGNGLVASIVPGALSGVVPTNLFAEFAMPAVGTRYFKLAAQTNGSQVTGCTVVIDATVPSVQTPVAGALPPTFQALIGIVRDGQWFRAIGPGSPVATSTLLYRTDKEGDVEPGEAPFEEWYAWVIE